MAWKKKEGWLRDWLKSTDAKLLAWCAATVAVWRVGLEFINQSIVPYLSPPSYALTRDLPLPSFGPGLHRWMTWDGGWYNLIEQHGYTILHAFQGPETVAFFPLFPGTVGVLSHLLHLDNFKVGLVVNFVFATLGMFMVYKLTRYFAEQKKIASVDLVAKVGAGMFLLTPASFFLAAHYAEPMLIFFFTTCIYFALQKQFWIAALMAGLASGTKSTGAILVVVVLLIWLGQEKNLGAYIRKIRENIVKLIGISVLSLSGLLSYMLYLLVVYHRPLAFVEIQKYWDFRGTMNPLERLWQHEYSIMGSLYHFGSNINYFSHLYLMVIPIVSIIIVCLLLRSKMREKYWLSVMIIFVVFSGISTGSLLSINRYILVLTPLLSLAVVYVFASRKQYVHMVGIFVAFLSTILLFIYTTGFLGGYFVG